MKSQVYSNAADGQTRLKSSSAGRARMAAYNKTLGRFTSRHRAGAQRRAQIEVTFEIDATASSVSARLGTATSRRSPSPQPPNLNENEISKAVKDAEQFAQEDKKRRTCGGKEPRRETCVYHEKIPSDMKTRFPSPTRVGAGRVDTS
jgi:molecular chaperone DnaK